MEKVTSVDTEPCLKKVLSGERARSPGGLIVAQSHIKVQDLFNKRNKKSFLKIRLSNLR